MKMNKNSQTTSTKCQYQAAASNPKCFVGVNPPAARPHPAHDQEARADNDVKAVEPGRQKEDRRIDAAAGEVERRFGIFHRLQAVLKVMPSSIGDAQAHDQMACGYSSAAHDAPR